MRTLILYKASLLYSFSLNFLSSFGQTFLISIFVPGLMASFHLSESDFGFYYSGLTLLSAALLPFSARQLERLSWKWAALILLASMALAALALSRSTHLFWVIAALFALRFGGQGLATHLSAVCTVKTIPVYRATALSIASTGFPTSEAFMPLLAYLMIRQGPWQEAWGHYAWALAALAIFCFGVGSLIDRKDAGGTNAASVESPSAPSPTVLKNPLFLIYLPSSLCFPFFATGLFLYQTSLATMKGWDSQQLSVALSAFALSRLLFSLLAGPWIDRSSAQKIFPYFLLPFCLGVAVLAHFPQKEASWIFMILTGMSAGISSPLKSALWTELFGAEEHGRYRAASTSLMIFGTALSPALFGWLIDRGLSVPQLLWPTVAIMLVAALPPYFRRLPS